MIRSFDTADMKAVLDIWLQASIRAHDFIAPSFWRENLAAMRDNYIPASRTYVYVEDDGEVAGFFCLHDQVLAALFVRPDRQGGGIGKQLLDKAKSLSDELTLSVYRSNTGALGFYTRCGFKTIGEQTDEHTGHRELLMAFHRKL